MIRKLIISLFISVLLIQYAEPIAIIAEESSVSVEGESTESETNVETESFESENNDLPEESSTVTLEPETNKIVNEIQEEMNVEIELEMNPVMTQEPELSESEDLIQEEVETQNIEKAEDLDISESEEILLPEEFPLATLEPEIVETIIHLDAEDEAVRSENVLEEQKEKRTEYSKTYSMENGLNVAEIYSEAIHQRTEGKWEEIEKTLVLKKTEHDYTYASENKNWKVQLPNELNSKTGISITKDGHSIVLYLESEIRKSNNLQMTKMNAEMSFQETSPSAVKEDEKDKTKLNYSGVYHNTDISYEVDDARVKESIIIKSYDASLCGYRYRMDTGELDAVLNANHEIELITKDTKEVLLIVRAPYLIDSAGKMSDEIEVELVDQDGCYEFNVHLPLEWLADEERVWPVILDPTIEEASSSNLKDRTLSPEGGFPEGVYFNSCGNITLEDDLRFFMKYKELPSLSSADVIVKATIELTQTNAVAEPIAIAVHEVTESWDENTITWENQPEYNELVEDYAICQNQNTYVWDITDLVQKWYSGENHGMVFIANEHKDSFLENNLINFGSSEHTQSANRPVLKITYRNAKGLESYWDCASSSLGRAGTGYVSNHTGNLVWTREDLGFGGNRMPVSISHIYDASASTENSYGLGYGWRSSYHQRVYQWTENGNYYIWEDADGTEHYFKYSSSSTYKDEDGLELTLKTNGSGNTKYSITDKLGNTSCFDEKGRLTKQTNNQKTSSSITITYTTSTGNLIDTITDGAGRNYVFVYEGALLKRLGYYGNDQNPLNDVLYSYDDGNLIGITDDDGKTCSYVYGKNHLLKAIEDVNGNKLNYEYNTEETGIPNHIIKIEQTSGNETGNTIEFEYAHNQTTLTDINGNVQILQFNDLGNTTSIQDDQGKAQYYRYALNDKESAATDETIKLNQIREISKVQNTVGNALRDNSFEYGTTWHLIDERVTQTNTTSAAYLGTHSLSLTRSETGTASGVHSSEVYVKTGETFTFSAYVKTDSSAYLALNDRTETVTSEVLDATSEWTRLQVSYTAKSNAYITARLMMEEAGNTYMDCVQLERAPTASRYSLIENGDFRYLESPAYGWSFSDLCEDTEKRVDLEEMAAPQLNYRGLSITGDPEKRKFAYQMVNLSGEANDVFILCGWAKGDSAPLETENSSSNEREFGLRAVFNYTDGTTEKFTVDFNPDAGSTDEWQYASMPMIPKKAYSSIKVELLYNFNVNTALFDGIQLYKEEFGTSYTYDANGNIKSVTDIQGQKTSYEYTGNDLTKEILPDGMELSYSYDSYHNVISASTKSGLVYSFDYDDYGNNTKVSLKDGTVSLSASAAYSSDGNRLSAITDAAGKTTTYNYTQNTNVLTWVEYPNDTEATRTKYTYTELYQLKSATVTTDTNTTLKADYSYDGDLLTAIQTNSIKYDFSYGPFGVRTDVKIGNRTLAQYSYTNHYSALSSLDYGNQDSVNYEVNKQNQVTKVTYEDGDVIVYEYDNNDNLGSVYDSATGITTRYHYDLSNRLAKYRETKEGYEHIVEYKYDNRGNLKSQTEVIDGTSRKTTYQYDEDNRITQITNNNSSSRVNNTYNGYGMLEEQKTYHSGALTLTESYTYRQPTENTITGQISSKRNEAASYDVTTSYEYDDNGNIIEIDDGSYTTTYEYDSLNQLIRENNEKAQKTVVWTYDSAGNITSRTEYAYTTGQVSSPVDTVTYSYTDNSWKDLLTEYDGQEIVYDEIGNPLSDGTWNYTWEHGRQLSSMSNGNVTWTYTYDASGHRKSRKGTTDYEYIYDGNRLSQMNIGDDVNYVFIYDGESPVALRVYNQGAVTTYYYVTNLQGDIVAILNKAGKAVVEYSYDAWGNVESITGDYKDGLGLRNPLMYRGYVYDRETKLYYLNSRYYDPETGRFLNTDIYPSTGQGLIGNNMYAYCGNNPVIRADAEGDIWYVIIAKATVGVLTQYTADVIVNVINGETGLDIFYTRSSTGEYIAAGITAVIPGSGVGAALVRNIISEGITSIEKEAAGETVDAVKLLKDVAVGTTMDVMFEFISDKVVDSISSKLPKNYSNYANTARKKNPLLTKTQIYQSMQRSIRVNRFISSATSFGIDTFRTAITME